MIVKYINDSFLFVPKNKIEQTLDLFKYERIHSITKK